MKTKYLLPNSSKIFGWVLLVISTIAWIIVNISNDSFNFLETKMFVISGQEFLGERVSFDWMPVNLTYTLIGCLFIIGGLIVAFSKEKREDEFIGQLRLKAFQIAVLTNYLVLLFFFLFIYGTDFFVVLIYNMFLTLILFILVFHISLLRNKAQTDEE